MAGRPVVLGFKDSVHLRKLAALRSCGQVTRSEFTLRPRSPKAPNATLTQTMATSAPIYSTRSLSGAVHFLFLFSHLSPPHTLLPTPPPQDNERISNYTVKQASMATQHESAIWGRKHLHWHSFFTAARCLPGTDPVHVTCSYKRLCYVACYISTKDA